MALRHKEKCLKLQEQRMRALFLHQRLHNRIPVDRSLNCPQAVLMDTDADCHIAFRHQAVLFVRSSVFGCLELSGARSQSVVLVMTTVKPLFSNSCLRAIAILRLTSFSMTPEVEILPGSLPPCADCSLRKL